MKIIYDSALINLLINQTDRIVKAVIPNLTAYHSLLVIKNIIETKRDELKKE